MISHFSRTPTCDRQTDTVQWHIPLEQSSRGNKLVSAVANGPRDVDLCMLTFYSLLPKLLLPFQSKDFWHQKARVRGLSCGVVYVILNLAILQNSDLWETQTDTQTQGHGIYRAEHSSRGKHLDSTLPILKLL